MAAPSASQGLRGGTPSGTPSPFDVSFSVSCSHRCSLLPNQETRMPRRFFSIMSVYQIVIVCVCFWCLVHRFWSSFSFLLSAFSSSLCAAFAIRPTLFILSLSAMSFSISSELRTTSAGAISSRMLLSLGFCRGSHHQSCLPRPSNSRSAAPGASSTFSVVDNTSVCVCNFFAYSHCKAAISTIILLSCLRISVSSLRSS